MPTHLTPDRTAATGTGSIAHRAEAVLTTVLPFLRQPREHHDHVIAECFAPQLHQISAAVTADVPLLLSLPAFPCKSPNRRKTLGPLPDLGEQLSLRFLQQLAQQVSAVHPPGARVLLCSDGHVFADVLGVPDAEVSAYGAELAAFVTAAGLDRIDTFDLGEVYGTHDFPAKRAALMAEHGEDLADLRAEVRSDDAALSAYRGMVRFMFEDALDHTYTGSRAALLRQSRRRAYEVMARSRAWSRLVDTAVGSTLRLSIHPQACGTPKFGIRLLQTDDSWLTPWHAVAVRTGDTVILMKREEAETAGAQLVEVAGRPDHFVLDPTSTPAERLLDPVGAAVPESNS